MLLTYRLASILFTYKADFTTPSLACMADLTDVGLQLAYEVHEGQALP